MPRARHNIAVAVLVTTGTLGGGIALSRTLELGPYHTPQPTVSQSLIDQRVEDLAEQRQELNAQLDAQPPGLPELTALGDPSGQPTAGRGGTTSAAGLPTASGPAPAAG